MKFKIQLGNRLSGILSSRKQSEQILSEIEETLISSDFGIDFTRHIIENLRKKANFQNPEKTLSQLGCIIKENMIVAKPKGSLKLMTAYLIFGVNGTGKTTTCGKLAYKLKKERKRVLIAAADTHRDAAVQQLEIWSRRAGVPIVRQHQGADPAAVVYDACDAAKARQVEALIVDTAGRLHNKEMLMEELRKIVRILDKKLPEAGQLKLLTIDATTGQNAIAQASQFNQYAGVDGIVLTKLDSSAKGGVACTISGLLKIPIIYAGTGESIKDLVDFNIDDYLDKLLH